MSPLTVHQSLLMEKGVHCETRVLAAGDFGWVLHFSATHFPAAVPAPDPPTAAAAASSSSKKRKERPPVAPAPVEILMDIVMERKNLSDLTTSIMDGRCVPSLLTAVTQSSGGMKFLHILQYQVVLCCDLLPYFRQPTFQLFNFCVVLLATVWLSPVCIRLESFTE